jgi:hypothetical protein
VAVAERQETSTVILRSTATVPVHRMLGHIPSSFGTTPVSAYYGLHDSYERSASSRFLSISIFVYYILYVPSSLFHTTYYRVFLGGWPAEWIASKAMSGVNLVHKIDRLLPIQKHR